MSFSQPRKRTTNTAIAIFLVILAIGVGAVYAFLSFTQTSPSTTIPAGTTMTPNCTSLANFTKPSPTTGSVAYSCLGQSDAFTVANGPITSTPIVHNLPSSVTLTFYAGVQNLSPCPGSTLSATIVNNTAMSIGSGSYNYCVFYNGLSSSLTFTFSVTWS